VEEEAKIEDVMHGRARNGKEQKCLNFGRQREAE
jgi:hypothetical protein